LAESQRTLASDLSLTWPDQGGRVPPQPRVTPNEEVLMLKRLALATILAGLAITATAAAHTTSYPSAISVDYRQCLECDFAPTVTYFVGGRVTSPKAKCVPARKVKLFAVYGGGKRGVPPPGTRLLLDVDRTSLLGAWSGFVPDTTGIVRFDAKVVKKNIGPRGHRHICGADTDSLVLLG
jgi:hypothetical protein